jgi:hypothetical protein
MIDAFPMVPAGRGKGASMAFPLAAPFVRA